MVENGTYKINTHKIEFLASYLKKIFKVLITYKQFPSFLSYYYIFSNYFYSRNFGSKCLHICLFGYRSVVDVMVCS